jgi:hypothetical protein
LEYYGRRSYRWALLALSFLNFYINPMPRALLLSLATFLLPLLCYGKVQRSAIDSLEFKKTEVSKLIKKELDSMKYAYKYKFSQPIPDCKQCSNLELMLILEIAVHKEEPDYPEKYIKNEPHFARKEDVAIKNKLKSTEAEYEKKFNIPAPWWWVLCPDKERIERLKKAIDTNTPYHYYSINESERATVKYINTVYTKTKTSYQLGKYIARHRIRFNRNPPECRYSNSECLQSLHTAFEIDWPYPAKEAEIELENKLKAEYEKKFGEQISDFELSITNIYLEEKEDLVYLSYFNRTTTGMSVINILYGEDLEFEQEYNIGEWLDFIRALYKCCITKWEKRFNGSGADYGFWRLEVQSNEIFFSHGTSSSYPANWNEFKKAIDNF